MTNKTPTSAALPWYNFPASRPILDAIWKEVADQLRAAGHENTPEGLDHTTQHRKLLEQPTLLLSQCCGPELFQNYAKKVVPVAAPIITAYPVTPGKYTSYIVSTRTAIRQNPRVAINSYSSHSGNTAMKNWLTTNGISSYSTCETGSHSRSVHEIQAGRADLAAIDALSWRFLDTNNLQILGSSEPVLAPPFITGVESTVEKELLAQTLNVAFKRHGEGLGITGVIPVTREQYRHLAISRQ